MELEQTADNHSIKKKDKRIHDVVISFTKTLHEGNTYTEESEALYILCGYLD